MRSFTWLVLVLTAAGCNESAAPVNDLTGLRESLATMNTVFASPLVRSLGSFWFGAPLPPPVAGAPLIPDSLLGRTFTFTCASQRYAVSSDSGAPPTGVRIILYRRATDGSIACPAAVIGQLDVFDVSTPDTIAVRGVAAGLAGGEPLVAYTLRHSVTDAPGVASATGFVSDGQQRLDFQVNGAPGETSHNTIATLQLDDTATGRRAVLHHEASMGVDTYSDAVDLSIAQGAGRAQLTGYVGWFNTFRSWDETVSVDDVPFARVGGSLVADDQEPAITPLNDQLFFTSDQRAVLLDFVNAPAMISGGLGAVLGAGRRLVHIAY